MVGLLFLGAVGQSAHAATLCVNIANTCQFTSISAAVSAASAGDTIQVAPGIYNESVIVNKSLRIVGSGRDRTIINALGQANGIFIDGTSKPPEAGVSNVSISGFSIQNANFEGILVGNAADVTITANQVSGNDRSLDFSNGVCPGLPAFETNEGEDCGEGIHLMAVHHSIVAGNIIKNNSGGILISDETGASHDNLIQGNTVSNNIYDCGITLASHRAAASSGLKSPAGVYHNTVSGNTVSGNGTFSGGGAGVGLFAPGPGNKTYGNVIVNNTIMGNGQPGVTMHNHAAPKSAPAPNLDDNLIIGNKISGNGSDGEDAATPGTAGINLYSVAPVTGTIVAQNSITNEQIAIAVKFPVGNASVQLNNFQVQTGVDNLGSSTINATLNYWGCPAGVGGAGCSGVAGMVDSGNPASTPFQP